jgi:hypothetical protein
MHNPGSNGRKYAQPWIPGPAVCTTLDTWGPGWNPIELSTSRRFAAAIPCGPVGIPSSDQRRPGQQLRSPRKGTRCTTLDPMAGSMHNPGSQGQQYAQPWIQGQQYADVCIHLENVCKQRPAVCKRLHTFGERLQTKASSMQTSAYIWRTSANKGQQYANVCIHLENVCKPRPAAAIPTGGDSMHNPGFNGRKYAQPWIHGPA